MKKRMDAKITGRVQMVMFRDFTRRNASRLGLVGEVRNRSDGSVEVIAEGEEEQLQVLLSLLHHGPVLADVEHVEFAWSEPCGKWGDFAIVHGVT